MIEKPHITKAQEAACPAGFENKDTTSGACGLSPTDLLALALSYAERGLPVFPLLAGRKGPVLLGGYKRASSDPAEARRLWAEAGDEGWNVGLATGNGIVAIDVDNTLRSAVDRIDRIIADPTRATVKANGKALLDKYGPLPPSWQVNTAGGGFHLLYKIPPHVRIRTKTSGLVPGVDTKAEGGYIVAAGSVVRFPPERILGDGAYCWKGKHSPAAFGEMAALPEVYQAAMQAHAATERRDGARTSPPPCCELDQPRAIEHARQWLRDAAPEAKQGEGGREATKHVVQRLGDFGVSSAGIFDLLSEDGGWNDTKADPPWAIDVDDSEGFRRLIEDLCAFHREKPAGCDFPYAASEVFEPGDGSSAAPTAPRKRLFRAGECKAAVLTAKRDPLVAGLLDKGALSLWFGETNVGKSFVLSQLALSIAAGAPFAGRRVTKGPAVYFAAEGGEGMKKRFAALLEGRADADTLQLFLVPYPVDLRNGRAGLDQMLADVREAEAQAGEKVALICIDTASRALAGGNENDSGDMGKLVQAINRLQHETGAHVAVSHHSGKDPDKGARGHSLLKGAVDTEFQIGKGAIKNTKQRDYERARTIGFRIDTAILGPDFGRRIRRVGGCGHVGRDVDSAGGSQRTRSMAFGPLRRSRQSGPGTRRP